MTLLASIPATLLIWVTALFLGSPEPGVPMKEGFSMPAYPRAFLLSPSRGLGGGIERYVETLESAFAAQGVEYERLDLIRSGMSAQARMHARARERLRAEAAPPVWSPRIGPCCR